MKKTGYGNKPHPESVASRLPVILGAVILGLLLVSLTACQSGKTEESVVIYTSLDQVFSEPILNDFEAESGIKVNAVYDVEAAKTTGLVNRLIAEKNRPQADVFWSSEFAQTLLLEEQGVLAAYASPSATDIPEQFRDPEDYWSGFAVRARVIIVNTDLVRAGQYPESIFDLLDPSWGAGEVAIANPLFGTTATHAAALFAALGPDRAKEYFKELLQQEARVVDGNSVVRDMAVSGEIKMGLTDTDDASIALEKGEPVAMIFPDQTDLGTLLIPNTVALINDAPHPQAAKRLIDFLLSPEVEAKLANCSSRQIPVRDTVTVPTDTPWMRGIRGMDVELSDVAGQMTASSTWLKEVFLR
jgi:iron(III) transport system substrate-binding protein